MMDVNANTILTINPRCRWYTFDARKSFIFINDDKENIQQRFFVDNNVVKIISGINGNLSISELTEYVNEKYLWNLSTENVITIIKDNLAGYNLFQGETEMKRIPDLSFSNKYIKLKLRIFPARVARAIAGKFVFLFSPKVFYTLLACTVLFNVALFFSEIGVSQFPQFSTHGIIFPFLHLNIIIPCLLLNFFSLLLHEFGHSSASEKFKAKCGEIGFGFYLLTPVLYSDVTEIWRLKKQQRIIVDLAGVYMQFLFMTILSVIYLFTFRHVYLAASCFIGIGALINLNPFLRFDGYWVLSDMANIVNLRSRSNLLANQFYGKMIGINKSWKPSPLNIFLTAYGVASMVFILLFVFYMLFMNADSVINFPLRIYGIIEALINGQSVSIEYLSSNILSFLFTAIFYYLAFKLIVNLFKKKKNAV